MGSWDRKMDMQPTIEAKDPGDGYPTSPHALNLPIFSHCSLPFI